MDNCHFLKCKTKFHLQKYFIEEIPLLLLRINQNAKQTFTIHERVRIPDAIRGKRLIEVKNVDYISNTLQLRDYADIARKYDFTLVLKVRPTTKVTQSVIDAGWIIKYLW